jgi:alkylated DNA repair dioxygenase AlkB
LTSELKQILSAVNELFNERYNGILVNRYNDGDDYIGAHHDDEKEIGATGIVTLSLGITRTLRFKCPGLTNIDHKLKDGTLFWFSNTINKKYTHEIPKSKLIKSPRLSRTFLYHKV